MNTITNCTIVDKYLFRHDDDNSSLYQYICRNGKVPVISAPTQATWPLNEQYCRTSLLLHWPNWRTTLDIKSDDTSWTEKFIEFLDLDTCPNFVKADIERAKFKQCENFENSSQENPPENNCIDQPEWIEAIRPNSNFDDVVQDFNFDDGGPEHDWAETSIQYPEDLGEDWWNKLESAASANQHLNIPDVDLTKMNKDQL